MTSETDAVYNPGIPRATDSFNSSQNEMLVNFSDLYDAFKKNHVALDDATAANRGNHTYIQLSEQEPTAKFQTNVSEISMYCKDVEGTTDQLFLRYQGNQDEFKYTCYQIYRLQPISDTKTGVTQTPYFSFLPGNILVYFGTIDIPAVNGDLDLKPYVAKKIVAMNFGAYGTIGTDIPKVPPQANIKESIPGIATQLTLVSSGQLVTSQVGKFSYFVMANL